MIAESAHEPAICSRRREEADRPMNGNLRLPTSPPPYPVFISVFRAEIRAHKSPVNRRLCNLLSLTRQKVAGGDAGLFNAAFAESCCSRGKGQRLPTCPLRLLGTFGPMLHRFGARVLLTSAATGIPAPRHARKMAACQKALCPSPIRVHPCPSVVQLPRPRPAFSFAPPAPFRGRLNTLAKP